MSQLISFSISSSLTWISGRRLVGSWLEPLIHPGSSIFGQGWKPQSQLVFHTGGHPKRRINHISKRTKPILFIYCLFNIIKIPKQSLTPSLSRPHSPASPSQVSPSKVPSCVLCSKPLKDLFDIEQGGIISSPLKKVEMRWYNACLGWGISGQLSYPQKPCS